MIVASRVGGDEGSQDAMTGNKKRLGEEVGDVAKATDRHDTKVSLADPAPDPMQAHIGGLGHPLRRCVGSNADGDLVVAE